MSFNLYECLHRIILLATAWTNMALFYVGRKNITQIYLNFFKKLNLKVVAPPQLLFQLGTLLLVNIQGEKAKRKIMDSTKKLVLEISDERRVISALTS